MSSAKPSKATISNAIAAALSFGCTPTSIKLGPDGTVTIDITTADTSGSARKRSENSGPRKFGEARI